MSIEDERSAVIRKAAGGGLAAIASLEIGALVWSAASIGYGSGIIRIRDLLVLASAACAILVVTGVLWVVICRDAAANPARRAILCLIVAVPIAFMALLNLDLHRRELAATILALSVSLAGMSLGSLIAVGIVRIYFAAISRRA